MIDPLFDDLGEPREPSCVEDGDPDSKRCNCLRCAEGQARDEAYFRGEYDAATPEERAAVIGREVDLDTDADRRDFADECFYDRDFMSADLDEAAE